MQTKIQSLKKGAAERKNKRLRNTNVRNTNGFFLGDSKEKN